jgi:hypothetical protein
MGVSRFLSIAAIVFSTVGHAAAPQAPFAAGPFESILQAVRVAHSCGIRDIRLSRWRDTEKTAAFFNQDVSRPSEMCLMRWMTKHGRQLKFEPRWYGDNFTKDWPDPQTSSTNRP